MNSVFSSDKEPFRSRPLAASLTIHAVLVVLMLILPARFGGQTDEPEPLDIVFYKPEAVEPQPIPLQELPDPEPQPQPPEIAEVEPPPPLRPEPPPEIRQPIARNEPPPRPRAKPVPPPVKPKPEPPKRTVRTAVLAETRPQPVAQPPRRVARTAGFGETEAPRQQRTRTERTVAPVGGFATAAADDAPLGRENTRVVASGSFSTGKVNVPREGKRPRGGSVINTSFDVADAEPTSSHRATGSVKQGGFGSGETVAPQPRRRKRPVENPDTPVAIVSKPTPVYTDEARELRIEGEVVLEVTFPASGRLRVLRVLGGLGHGLDEAAIDAAEKIEFKPARRGGRPVNHTVTLRVVFQLA